MQTIEIKVQVPKEAYEVGLLLAALIKAIKAKKQIMQIVAEEFKDLTTAINGIDQVPAEAKADLMAFINAFQLPVQDAIREIIKPNVLAVEAPGAEGVQPLLDQTEGEGSPEGKLEAIQGN